MVPTVMPKVTATVAVIVAPAVVEPSWDEDGEGLFGSTADQRLEGWVAAAKSGGWTADSASDGVIGKGPAEMVRGMPDGPWTVGGVLEPLEARRAEIFARFADGTRHGITAEVLGQNTLVRWTLRGEPVGNPVSLAGTAQLSVQIVRVGDELRIEIGSDIQRFRNSSAASIGLAVAEGTASFHDFVLMVPVQ